MTKLVRCACANECHSVGLNCAQSLLTAFCDVTGLTEEQSAVLCGGFGGGMRYGGVCGVVSAAVMVLGTVCPATRATGAEGKRRAGELTMEFERRFKERFGNLDCHALKANPIGEGTEMANTLQASNHCRMLIISGTELLHDMLTELEEK